MQKQETVADGVLLPRKEAVEYYEYKRNKKREEICEAISRSESVLRKTEDIKRAYESARKLRQTALRVTPVALLQVGKIFKDGPVLFDCVIGGDGETLPKVKAYETKQALRLKAKEITLALSPSSALSRSYGGIRKELKKLRRITQKAVLKVQAQKGWDKEILSSLCRICSEVGVDYFCVPYFDGCERLLSDLSGGCRLEISEISDTETYKKLVGAGVGRIVSDNAEHIYTEWLKELEKIRLPEVETGAEKLEKTEKSLFLKTLPLLLPAERTGGKDGEKVGKKQAL